MLLAIVHCFSLNCGEQQSLSFHILYYLVPSAPPSRLNTQVLSSTILLVTWYEPPFSEQNGILTKYRVTWRGLERDTEERLEDISVNSTSNTSYVLTDLDAYTSYEVNVSSFTSVGAGPTSSTTVTTLQDSELNLIVFLTVYLLFIINQQYSSSPII